MALDFSAQYPGRWQTADTDYPQGKFLNETGGGNNDRSYLDQGWANDWSGFMGRILDQGGEIPNGVVDTAQVSQMYDALMQIIFDEAGQDLAALRIAVGIPAGQTNMGSYSGSVLSDNDSSKENHQQIANAVEENQILLVETHSFNINPSGAADYKSIFDCLVDVSSSFPFTKTLFIELDADCGWQGIDTGFGSTHIRGMHVFIRLNGFTLTLASAGTSSYDVVNFYNSTLDIVGGESDGTPLQGDIVFEVNNSPFTNDAGPMNRCMGFFFLNVQNVDFTVKGTGSGESFPIWFDDRDVSGNTFGGNADYPKTAFVLTCDDCEFLYNANGFGWTGDIGLMPKRRYSKTIIESRNGLNAKWTGAESNSNNAVTN